MENRKVFAIVVTYNRLPLLQKTIAALLGQSFALYSIVVVNNSSSDGTKEWLDGQPYLTAIHQENLGGAGGFRTGVHHSMLKGADWLWLMDDDVLPEKNCLQIMMQYTSVSRCINPIHINPDGLLSDEERWFDAASCQIINLYNRSYQHGKKLWFRNLGSFEGMLIAGDVVEKIGLPDERFFVAHDDLVYGYLASRFTNVAVAADAVIKRQPVTKTPAAIYNYDYYYMYRNLWLLEAYANKELPLFQGYRKRRVLMHFLYGIYKIFFVDKPPEKSRALKTLFVAYKDYRKKKAGKREI
jgi:rhamnopyranosyl-N-acetylglucosaminyl-diphospho-decaprenol beta-1,3/1,4-galactofuranosyltransferase